MKEAWDPTMKHSWTAIIGKTYGSLIVDSILCRKGNNTKVRCRCISCGAVKDAWQQNLINGTTSRAQCACYPPLYDHTRMERLDKTLRGKQLCGQVILGVVRRPRSGWAIQTKCNCGKLTMRGLNAEFKSTSPCSCLYARGLAGKIFGFLEVIALSPTRDSLLCRCICGATVTKRLQELQLSINISCGCMRQFTKREMDYLRDNPSAPEVLTLERQIIWQSYQKRLTQARRMLSILCKLKP
jgi:hypothetical protein